jgi:hypothetical protein
LSLYKAYCKVVTAKNRAAIAYGLKTEVYLSMYKAYFKVVTAKNRAATGVVMKNHS